MLPFAATEIDFKWIKSEVNPNTVWYHLHVESKNKIQQSSEKAQKKEIHRFRQQLVTSWGWGATV